MTHLRWRQSAGGIPALDNDLRIDVAGDGSVIDVLGSPQPGLTANATSPKLGARDAMRRLMDDVGARRPTPSASEPAAAASR